MSDFDDFFLENSDYDMSVPIVFVDGQAQACCPVCESCFAVELKGPAEYSRYACPVCGKRFDVDWSA